MKSAPKNEKHLRMQNARSERKQIASKQRRIVAWQKNERLRERPRGLSSLLPQNEPRRNNAKEKRRLKKNSSARMRSVKLAGLLLLPVLALPQVALLRALKVVPGVPERRQVEVAVVGGTARLQKKAVRSLLRLKRVLGANLDRSPRIRSKKVLGASPLLKISQRRPLQLHGAVEDQITQTVRQRQPGVLSGNLSVNLRDQHLQPARPQHHSQWSARSLQLQWKTRMASKLSRGRRRKGEVEVPLLLHGVRVRLRARQGVCVSATGAIPSHVYAQISLYSPCAPGTFWQQLTVED